MDRAADGEGQGEMPTVVAGISQVGLMFNNHDQRTKGRKAPPPP